jgi:acyl carrier protein
MNQISEGELVHRVIRCVHENTRTNGFDHLEITPETNLISSGVLTSLGIIDLLVFIEGRTNCKIDLTDVEPDEFAIVKSLCRLALKNRNGES